LALDTIARERGALQNQQAMQQPAKPPVYQQLQQQAMPQQMAQAMPQQGIDAAQSNLPQQYAGGGIIAFDEGGKTPKVNDISFISPGIKEWLANKLRGVESSMQQVGGIKDVQKNLFNSSASTDSTPDELGRHKAGVDNGIVIHPNAPRGPAPSPAPAAPTYKPADTSGIDSLTKGFENMIRGGEDFGKAESKAEKTAMRNLFLNMMNPEKGASFVGGLGAAGKEAQAGLDKSLEGIQARKEKQIGQLVALGLKGEELKNAAKKMGIDETELQAKMPLYAAQANYYNTAKGRAGGAGLGSVTPAVADKVMERYDAYRQDYKNPNNPFVAMLDPKDQTFLREGKGKSLATARQKLNDLIDMEQDRRLRTLAGYNSKQRVASPIED
jgi:hypothetical protein